MLLAIDREFGAAKSRMLDNHPAEAATVAMTSR
jgi:hypothetical protein